jgi:hypothetical protein
VRAGSKLGLKLGFNRQWRMMDNVTTCYLPLISATSFMFWEQAFGFKVVFWSPDAHFGSIGDALDQIP